MELIARSKNYMLQYNISYIKRKIIKKGILARTRGEWKLYDR